MRYIWLSLLLTGCASTHTCEDYGVRNTHDPRPVRHYNEASQDEVNRICSEALHRPEFYRMAGCTILNDDGTVDLWWRTGDHCAKEHEEAHAECGFAHTAEYQQLLIAGHPRPYCPAFR